LEKLIPFDKILHEDPVGAYPAMDAESRNLYRETVSQIAQRCDRTELEVAAEALALARQAHQKPSAGETIELRESHIGYYLVGDGAQALREKVGYHPSVRERILGWLRRNPDEFFLLGIAVLTLAITAGAVFLLTSATTPLTPVALSMLVLLLPGSQAAVQLMNYLTTSFMPVAILPKLDFSKGIPGDCVTLVAIPALLLNEKQVRKLVEDLEVRYLGNHDRNLHFALVTDLQDSHRSTVEDSSLVALCAGLIRHLNERYAARGAGSFFLLHRHRVYNPRERAWMGWERKRGKLLDLNRLLRGLYDSFPAKVGDCSLLSSVRFVITLDSDTELPRGSASRMVGALAHPLNRAIVDPIRNIVVAGYGILQPRVDVSVRCAARSRLAAVFSGASGLDPYTHAVSDAYQDLYGEGTFAGKGIYEVDTMVRVLDRRFPRNSLLSHDLLEGAYARAGLATDIVIIEDYPTHYSAYSRRKHRWLRGDWQIVEWLRDRVRDESGARVPNPISLVSRWKILDNLRRSLVEPATFALLLFAWLATGHPLSWTIATICILFLPAWTELAAGLVRALIARQASVARDAMKNFAAAASTLLLTLTLLAHQALLSLDAAVRTLVRHLLTRQRLLEWETAAEAELQQSRAQVDRYIDWTFYLAIGLGALIWLTRPHSLLAALPILGLWACSQQFALWLNDRPIKPLPELTSKDVWLLRKSALHTWRYFLQFSNAEHNWLIPDHVEANPLKVAARVSPTNIGLLLNARQAANELGYITTPEFAELTHNTLLTVSRLPKYRGHLFNWYDTPTLEPKSEQFVSSVDSGNLVASLWTLQQGCLDRLHQPILPRALAEGVFDHVRVLVSFRALSKQAASRFEAGIQGEDWLAFLLNLPEETLAGPEAKPKLASEVAWFRRQAHLRIERIRGLATAYLPWILPEYADLRKNLESGAMPAADMALERLPDLISEWTARLENAIRAVQNGNRPMGERLWRMLLQSRQNAVSLIEDLRNTSRVAGDLANAMDFGFLTDKERLLMSVGFDAHNEELQPYYYDLLATEPRTAVFVAIAKEDVPQDCWFQLNRPFARDRDHTVLLSWTGTMFEYLMPSLWMRGYPNTLLDRSILAAVRSQQEYAKEKGIPWGISESACAKRNETGEYHYEAFGVPSLALKRSGSDPMVVSPYSTFLSLHVDPQGALTNLRRMDSLGWFGPYGFYDAADYTNSRGRLLSTRFELVQSWMVHHQGMSLLSLANFLCDNVVQRWFHSEPRVRATELLLQERPATRLA